MSKVKGDRIPVAEFMKPQGRFKHLFKPGNEQLLEQLQRECDEYYAYIEARCNAEG